MLIRPSYEGQEAGVGTDEVSFRQGIHCVSNQTRDIGAVDQLEQAYDPFLLNNREVVESFLVPRGDSLQFFIRTTGLELAA